MSSLKDNKKTINVVGEFCNEMLIEKTNEFENILAEVEELYTYNDGCKYDGDKRPMPTIHIRISSWGGYVDICNAITDYVEILKEYGCLIITECIGFAYSCGAILFTHGDLRLFGTTQSKLMWHQFKCGEYGDVDRAKKNMIESEIDNKLVNQYFADHTKVTMEMIEAKKHEEWYIRYNEAVELGIICEDIEQTEWYAKLMSSSQNKKEEVQLVKEEMVGNVEQ